MPNLLFLTIIAIIVAIANPILMYIIQRVDKRDRISRSCYAIIRELNQNKIALIDEKFKHIKYKLAREQIKKDNL